MYQKYRPYASLNPVKSHSGGKPPFSPTISSSSPPFKPVVCKTDTLDPSFKNEFKTPGSREIPGSLPRKPAPQGSSNKSDHNVSSDLGPSSCHDPPIPTGPKSLIERISFTPHTLSSFPLGNFNLTNSVVAKTPETGVPIEKMQSDQLSKALSALAALSHKLKMNSSNLTQIAEPTRANRGHRFHSEDNERFSVGSVHPIRQTYRRPEKGFSTSPRRRYTREDDRRRSSSCSSFHHEGHSGRFSQRRSSYRTYEAYYSTQNRHRHRHGHHNHNRRYDHYRPKSDYRPTTNIIKDELKGFEHHFKVDEEEEKTIEPKYIGISEDGRRLIFGSKRREVELALLAAHKDEDIQGAQSAGELPVEENRTGCSPSERLGSPLRGDHESVSQVDVVDAGVVAEPNENRDSNERGLSGAIQAQTVLRCERGSESGPGDQEEEQQAEESELSTEESKEGGEISEALDHIDNLNNHAFQSQTEVVRKCQLVGKTSRNALTTDTLSRFYSKSSSPNFDTGNTLTPKPRVYRISDLSSDILDLMGIQLRYAFKNDNLNRSDRWEDILDGGGKGKVLRLAGRDLGIRLGMSNSEFEIDGILRNGSSHSVDDESDRACKRSRSRSRSADNEEEVERLGRKRKRIII
ncbi:uncharacterized protein L199_002488 [Kwoniella botswanensis]|uniref:uncharacterized protein n=1 Tax=Kwoniella botswanensis TaxID=1268659 RepID=UPI00315D59B4